MNRIERCRLAAALCLIGGSVDAVVLAGWAWPRAIDQRRAMASRAEAAIVGIAPVAPRAPAPPATPTGMPTAASGVAASGVAPAAPGTEPPAPDVDTAFAHAPVRDLEDGLPTPGTKAASSSVGVILFGKRAGSHWIDPDQALTRTAERASHDPDLVVEIDGYADHHGDRRNGKKLSLRRARQIAMELESAGVAPDRMILRGHVVNRTRARGRGRSALKSNRRVEIRMHTRGR